MSGRLIYEVFPYAAVVRMLGRHFGYKRGRLVERKKECLKLPSLIEAQNPGLNLPDGIIEDIVRSGSAGMKAVADKIDSLLCAISVYRHAIYRGLATEMVGDGENGFILLCR
jgi:predicted RNase H-like nuclease